jgi:hypothetical protein
MHGAHLLFVTDAYAAPQADDLYRPLCREERGWACQIRPKDEVRAVPKSLSQYTIYTGTKGGLPVPKSLRG